MHARTAVNVLVAFRMNLFHLRNHLGLTLGTVTGWTLSPCIKPTSPHLQHITQNRDRPFFAVLFDELISQFFSLAKKAVGQVARDDCSSRAPTDPYVPTLEHTAPHIRRSPHDVGRPNAQLAVAEAGMFRVAD
jgi:hypothetical protein